MPATETKTILIPATETRTTFIYGLPDGTYIRATVCATPSESRGEWVTCNVARHLCLTSEQLNGNFASYAGHTRAETIAKLDMLVDAKRAKLQEMIADPPKIPQTVADEKRFTDNSVFGLGGGLLLHRGFHRGFQQ